jgi:hypothetical protein
MKPWPTVLRERYPAHPFADEGCPARPWWQRADLSAKYRASRAGLAVHVVSRPGWLRSDGQEVNSSQSDDEQLAKFDRENPLPRPSLRVGQIWANEVGNAVQIVSADNSRALVATYVPTGPSMATLGVAPFAASAYQFLVHDPCCPWLAPWSPLDVDDLARALITKGVEKTYGEDAP